VKFVYLNGDWLRETEAGVSVFDRAFLYGDSLFETVRVYGGRPFQFAAHCKRLKAGADYLKIRMPCSARDINAHSIELLSRNSVTEGLLRIQLSRGIGPRGFGIREAKLPTLLISTHPAPALGRGKTWKLITASNRLWADDPLAKFKTGNKLPQILARAEAERTGADEALLLNSDGFVAEGASTNLFAVFGRRLVTPPLSAGILPGVTRRVVMDLANGLAVRVAEENISAKRLRRAEAIFLTSTAMELIPVREWDSQCFPVENAIFQKLIDGFRKLVAEQTVG